MNKKQRQTLNKIFEKPERSDIAWVNIDGLVKSSVLVTPAQAGVQNVLEIMDSGLRQNDGCAVF